MKKSIFICLATAFIFTACNNEDKQSTTGDSTSTTIVATPAGGNANTISFKVNGIIVNTEGLNISRTDMGGMTVLNVTSDMHKDGRAINININGTKAGTYKMAEGMKAIKAPDMAYGTYYPDYTKDMSSTYIFEDGELVISAIDTTANLLNATFTGTVSDGKGSSFILTDGKIINGTMRPGITRF